MASSQSRKKAASSQVDLLSGAIAPVLVRLTGPMMMGIVSLMLFNLVDLYFVGLLGTLPLAAIGFTFPVTFAVTSLAIGLGVGTSATVGRLIGAGRSQEAKALVTDNLLATFAVTTVLALILSQLITPIFQWMGASPELLVYIKDYMGMWLFGSVYLVVNMVANATMRAAGDTRTPAKVMAISAFINLLLDPLLIFGWGPIPAMGIKGAALATVLAWGVTSCLVFYLLHHRQQVLLFKGFDFARIGRHWYQVMVIGLPAAFSNMLTPIANAILTAFVAGYGPEAVAAFGVGSRLESLSLLVCLALSMSLPPFISQNMGAEKQRRAVAAYGLALKFALLWQLVVYLALLSQGEAIAALFSDQSSVQSWIIIWLGIVPMGFGFQAVTFLTASSFNAMHQPMRAMRISLIRLFVFYVPMAWLGSTFFGLTGMFVALVIANSCTALVAWYLMRQYAQRLLLE